MKKEFEEEEEKTPLKTIKKRKIDNDEEMISS